MLHTHACQWLFRPDGRWRTCHNKQRSKYHTHECGLPQQTNWRLERRTCIRSGLEARQPRRVYILCSPLAEQPLMCFCGAIIFHMCNSKNIRCMIMHVCSSYAYCSIMLYDFQCVLYIHYKKSRQCALCFACARVPAPLYLYNNVYC